MKTFMGRDPSSEGHNFLRRETHPFLRLDEETAIDLLPQMVQNQYVYIPLSEFAPFAARLCNGNDDLVQGAFFFSPLLPNMNHAISKKPHHVGLPSPSVDEEDSFR